MQMQIRLRWKSMKPFFREKKLRLRAQRSIFEIESDFHANGTQQSTNYTGHHCETVPTFLSQVWSRKSSSAVPQWQRQNATVTAVYPMTSLSDVGGTAYRSPIFLLIRLKRSETELSCRARLAMQAFESSTSLRYTGPATGVGMSLIIRRTAARSRSSTASDKLDRPGRPEAIQCSSSPVYHTTRIHVVQTLRWVASSIGKYIASPSPSAFFPTRLHPDAELSTGWASEPGAARPLFPAKASRAISVLLRLIFLFMNCACKPPPSNRSKIGIFSGVH